MCSFGEKSLILLVVGLISSSNHSTAFQPSSTSSSSQTYPQHYYHHHHVSRVLQSPLNALPNHHSSHDGSSSSSNNSFETGKGSFANAVRNGWQPEFGSFSGLKRRHSDGKVKTVRSMADTSGAIMPDGGLSPCIIKVVGVGGGGCNAVSAKPEDNNISWIIHVVIFLLEVCFISFFCFLTSLPCVI